MGRYSYTTFLTISRYEQTWTIYTKVWVLWVPIVHSTIMNLPYTIPVEMIAVGFAVSVIVGLIAGVYPVNKAAKMNPVDALRSE